MASWLQSYTWSAYATFTFRYPPSVSSAMRSWRTFANRQFDHNVSWFIAVECGKLLGRVHLHGLLANIQRDLVEPERDVIEGSWRKRHGIAQVVPLRPGEGAEAYCCKYLTKEVADWDIHLCADARQPGPHKRLVTPEALASPLGQASYWRDSNHLLAGKDCHDRESFQGIDPLHIRESYRSDGTEVIVRD